MEIKAAVLPGKLIWSKIEDAEPASLALFGTGLAGLTQARRRKAA